MDSECIIARINADIKQILNNSLNVLTTTTGLGDSLITDVAPRIVHHVLQDLSALASKDPAAQNEHYVYETYSSFLAVMNYRIAHELYEYTDDDSTKELLRFIAGKISDSAKVKTSIDIHPAAKIGDKFVIDHGVNTVIGETVEIGNNCYLLQGVVLGYTGVSNNPTGRRHPRLGNNVQVAGDAKILGPVSIGNDVFIGANCIVLSDIPDGATVSLSTQCQINRHADRIIEVYGIVPDGPYLLIYGNDLSNVKAYLVNENYKRVFINSVLTHEKTPESLFIEIERRAKTNALKMRYHIGLYLDDSLLTVIRSPIGLKRYLESQVYDNPH